MKGRVYKYFVPLFMITAGVIAFLFFAELKIFSQVTYPVTVTNIRFLYGVGRGPTSPAPDTISNYYRGYGLPGTLIEITAQMTVGGNPAPVYGDVVFTVRSNDTLTDLDFNVTVKSGKNIGTAVIPYNTAAGFFDLASGNTTAVTYTVISVSGDYAGALVGSPTRTIYWDRQDPPLVPAITGRVADSNSFTLYWTPVGSAAPNDEDFYEYRIHYREEGASALRTWDGSNDPTMRGLSNNVCAGSCTNQTTHFLNGSKYTSVTGLKLFTVYEFFLSSVDVFGNESYFDIANPEVLTTLPYKITVSISDGIDSYDDFSYLDRPDLRTLREANIEVNMDVRTAGTSPDTVRVWFANYSDSTDIVNIGTNTINSTAFAPGTLYGTDAVQKTANKWIAYLSSQTAVIKQGNSVRFIIETVTGGVSAFSDLNLSDNDPNTQEWTFHVGTATNFKPWPVRVLNNVITKQDPVAYPSYYLTDDAYVTIKIFDIKGRPVAVLMDGVFRRGGQNIKEEGWMGTNKAKKKLGVGLYYMHFRAKRASDGKIILNEFSKVVMAY